MARKKKITEEIQIDKGILNRFRNTCNILEVRFIRKLEDMMSDFIARKQTYVDSYLRRTVKEPIQAKNIRNGPELLYEIEKHVLASEGDAVGNLIAWIRDDLDLDTDTVMRVKKNLAEYGIGISREGHMYVAILQPELIAITGNRRYSTEMRRCEEYRETKTCGLAGKPVRCMVFDISGGE